MQPEAASRRAPLSAFVIAYNRAPIIGTCLRALAFADELIVVDKGSTDATPQIAAALADRVISVPWSPTVEETRAFAAAQCTHDWILFLDDDECLSVEAVRFLDAELAAPRADLYRLPQRHYIIGRHDERAYYWPEHQTRCFRRGSLAFTDTVHGGMRMLSERIYAIPPETGACIHHLSHRDVAQFIEKTNRYTSQPDRLRSLQAGSGIARFAHERIDHWLALTDACEPDAYPAAVAVLRAVYDLIDRLKGWEEEAGLDGTALFRTECARLDAAYAQDLASLARPRTGAASMQTVPAAAAEPPPAAADTPALLRAVAALRDSVQAQRHAMDAARTDLEAARLRETEQRERAAEMQRWAESESRRAADAEARLGEFARHHDATRAKHAAAAAAWTAEREAQRSAWQAEREAWDAERAGHAAEHARLSDVNTGLEDQLSQALARAVAAEARAVTAEAGAAAAAARIVALEASTSWRMTAPMRAALVKLGRR
jgi:hypothetical protein